MTVEEYFATGEETNQHAELWRGEVMFYGSKSEIHQDILARMACDVRDYIRSTGCNYKPMILAFDFVIGEDTVVQPDFTVICDREKLKDGLRCWGAPDLAVEIVSSETRSMDYCDKLVLYRDTGVREYWIIDPEKENILIYIFENSTIKDVNFYSFDEPIPVRIFDGKLKLTINDFIY